MKEYRSVLGKVLLIILELGSIFLIVFGLYEAFANRLFDHIRPADPVVTAKVLFVTVLSPAVGTVYLILSIRWWKRRDQE